jgi:hypothetical protein
MSQWPGVAAMRSYEMVASKDMNMEAEKLHSVWSHYQAMTGEKIAD